MAISHKARFCNGFPHFVSNTDVLEPAFYSMLILSFRSIPVLSGHESGRILFRAREKPCLRSSFQPDPKIQVDPV